MRSIRRTCSYWGFYDIKNVPARSAGTFQRVEKASQSFAPAGAKEMQIIFPGGVYVGKIHAGLQVCRLYAIGGQLVRAAVRGLLSKNSFGVFRQPKTGL